jgi:hypothetical protein
MKPEEEELIFKDKILKVLEEELLASELSLSQIKKELYIFENRYNEIVGMRFLKLERLKAELRLIVDMYSDNNETAEWFSKKNSFSEKYRKHIEEEVRTSAVINGSKSLATKDLFRKVAKKIHPDLSNDDNDRIIREELMKRANIAFLNNDVESLQQILIEWENIPDNIVGNDLGSSLIRTIRKIALIKERIKKIDEEKVEIGKSDIHKFYQKDLKMKSCGGDLLQAISDEVNKDIEEILTGIQKLIY